MTQHASVAAADTIGGVDSTFEIHVPTNIDLSPNLKGRLLLTTVDMDNNVRPGNTICMVNALIKAHKRFDFMMMPGKPQWVWGQGLWKFASPGERRDERHFEFCGSLARTRRSPCTRSLAEVR